LTAAFTPFSHAYYGDCVGENGSLTATDNIRNISTSQLSLDKCNSQKRNNKKYLKFEDRIEEGEGKVMSLCSNISYCNISRIDIPLKNNHKRWSI
jgi:hypothetical protein